MTKLSVIFSNRKFSPDMIQNLSFYRDKRVIKELTKCWAVSPSPWEIETRCRWGDSTSSWNDWRDSRTDVVRRWNWVCSFYFVTVVDLIVADDGVMTVCFGGPLRSLARGGFSLRRRSFYTLRIYKASSIGSSPKKKNIEKY